MKIITILFLTISCFAADKHDWKTGKVLDSQAAKTYFQTGATTTATGSATASNSGSAIITGDTVSSTNSTTATAQGTADTRVHHMAIQSTQLLIVGDEYSYLVDDNVEKAVGPPLHGSLGRAIANRKHGCRYVVNDEIEYAQEKSSLYVRDPDGKTCKLDIVRQERLQPTLVK